MTYEEQIKQDYALLTNDRAMLERIMQMVADAGGVVKIEDTLYPDSGTNRYGNRIYERTYTLRNGEKRTLAAWRARRSLPLTGTY